MKIKATAACAALLCALQAACHSDPGSDSGPDQRIDAVTISVIGTNDVHGRLAGNDSVGGLALFGGYVANLREARQDDGGAVLLIGAGDMWQGTLESNIPEGAPIVAAYNALHYDAVAIGNHEFDFGPIGPAAMPESDDDDPRGALKARASEASFPFLAANIIDMATDEPVSWPNVTPTLRMDVAGVPVGIVGLTSRTTLSTTLSANVVGLRIANLAQTIQAEAGKLRADGVSLIIVAAHAGGECTDFTDPRNLDSCDPDSEIFEVARALPAGLVDLIIAGHIHKGIAHEVNGIAIISSMSGGVAFGRVDFEFVDGVIAARTIFPPTRICGLLDPDSGDCVDASAVDLARIASYEGRAVEPDVGVAAVVAPAIAAASAIKNEKLGPFLETPFRRQTDPESAIGNLFTDLLLASAPGADVAIYNTIGGVRDDLPAGDITYGDVYEMLPFDNRIVHLALSGRDLRAIVANQIEGPRRRANVSGARVFARCGGNALHVRMTDRSGREIHDDDELLVVTNDFLVSGGDNVLTPAMPENGFEPLYIGPPVRDIIVDWMRNHAGRLNADQYVDDANPRWNFSRPAPLVCGKTVG